MERDTFCPWFATNPAGYARPYILEANPLNMKQVYRLEEMIFALNTQKVLATLHWPFELNLPARGPGAVH